jgi:hypothetical protein
MKTYVPNPEANFQIHKIGELIRRGMTDDEIASIFNETGEKNLRSQKTLWTSDDVKAIRESFKLRDYERLSPYPDGKSPLVVLDKEGIKRYYSYTYFVLVIWSVLGVMLIDAPLSEFILSVIFVVLSLIPGVNGILAAAFPLIIIFDSDTGFVGYLALFAIYGFWAIPPWVYHNMQESQRGEFARFMSRLNKEVDAQVSKAKSIQGKRQQDDYALGGIKEVSAKAISEYETLPVFLKSAENYLDQAEQDFREHAYSPFWDSIERAAFELGKYSTSIKRIEYQASQYADLVKTYTETAPPFSLSKNAVNKLKVMEGTDQRMKRIVREAHKDPNYSVIYEQRRTNQILIAGFNNLASAIYEMSSAVNASIDHLSASIDGLDAEFGRTVGGLRDSIDNMNSNSDRQHQEYMVTIAEQRQREDKTIQLLDNIYRGRKPTSPSTW